MAETPTTKKRELFTNPQPALEEQSQTMLTSLLQIKFN